MKSILKSQRDNGSDCYLCPTHLSEHFQSSSVWLAQVEKELIKPKERKAANSLEQQKFGFLPSWKSQKGSQSSPSHAIAIIFRSQDPLPGSIHWWRGWGQKTREVRWEPEGILKCCPEGILQCFPSHC